MALSAAQVKGRIKNIAKQSGADARMLIRIYMTERFLERVSASEYADNFIIKGGILVTAMLGVSKRSTMDMDTTLRNLNLSESDALRIVREIASIDLDDDVSFRIKDISGIMDEMEYPGIRIIMDAIMEKMVTPVKIDISTGDVITPGAIEYSYKLMLEDRSISLWSYNLETILAEKLQTVLVRGVLNTRMRDFYDIHSLLAGYAEKINVSILRKAFHATCEKRQSLQLENHGKEILFEIAEDVELPNLWNSYREKYEYAVGITYDEVIESVVKLHSLIEE